MNKEQNKKITFEQLIRRREQREEEKSKVIEIYVESMDGTLLFKKLPEDEILDIYNETDTKNISSLIESTRKIIYLSCPLLQDKNLHSELGIVDPFDVPKVLFDLKETDYIGSKLFEFNGISKAITKVEENIKN